MKSLSLVPKYSKNKVGCEGMGMQMGGGEQGREGQGLRIEGEVQVREEPGPHPRTITLESWGQSISIFF